MRKKTAEEKKREGTYRKSRDVERVLPISPITGIPEPLNALTESQERAYYYLFDLLKESKLVVAVDVVILTQLAIAIDLAEQARQALEQAGTIQTYKTGARAVSPELSVWRQATEVIERLGAKFGLSPKDRNRLLEAVKKEEEPILDPLYGFDQPNCREYADEYDRRKGLRGK